MGKVRQTYFANVRKMREKYPEAAFIAVTFGHPRAKCEKWVKELAPSAYLLKGYKFGQITWEQYIKIFVSEVKETRAQKALLEITELAKDRDVFLVCYEKEHPCHRFILLDILEGVI